MPSPARFMTRRVLLILDASRFTLLCTICRQDGEDRDMKRLERQALACVFRWVHLKEWEAKLSKLTLYEQSQEREVKAWKAEEPGVVGNAFGVAVTPLNWLVEKVVPRSAVKGALDFSNGAAKWLTDTRDIQRRGEVSSIKELRHKDLELSDKLADGVRSWAIGLAVAEGAAAGAFGLPGMAVDVPALITLALRTIHKVGVCYGYETKTDVDARFVMGIMAASGANTIEEKAIALTSLRSIQVTLVELTWRKINEKAAQSQFGREAMVMATKALAKELGVNITKRKALAAIPFIGAAVGGSVNGWYIREVGWAARRMYQERWLIENGKILEAIGASKADFPRAQLSKSIM